MGLIIKDARHVSTLLVQMVSFLWQPPATWGNPTVLPLRSVWGARPMGALKPGVPPSA
jgi:hypothetical protein